MLAKRQNQSALWEVKIQAEVPSGKQNAGYSALLGTKTQATVPYLGAKTQSAVLGAKTQAEWPSGQQKKKKRLSSPLVSQNTG